MALAVDGPYIYDAANSNGLVMLWFSPPVSGSIPPTGGGLESPGDGTSYTFPDRTFSENVNATHVARFPGNTLSV